MPLETGTYISDLVSSNPAHTDSLNNADAHMRLIKGTLQATFPGVDQAITKAVGSDFQIIMPDGSGAAPSYSFVADPALGLYRASAGVIKVAGGRLVGTAPLGSIHMFMVEPEGLGKGGIGTGHEYLELDGSTWNTADFPDLANHLNTGGAPTFTLWNVKDTGRFLRSRTSTIDRGIVQANSVKAHTHSVSGTTGTESNLHYHNGGGTTSSMNRNATHTHSVSGGIYGGFSYGTFSQNDVTVPKGAGLIEIVAANTDHEHAFAFTTGTQNASHTHNFSATSGSTGDTETRPEALTVVMCIKT